ncbi:hypothetical protein [Deinococcus aluminii]|uniref:Lipoprotein n=1 Tax=Deinococcus aluminii TaxID=1656885 RepID=A0ABP9XEE8_9DEIO
MRKLGLFALPLLLAACGGTGPSLGQAFSAQAGVSGAQVDVTIVRVYDKATGAFKYNETAYRLTQPQVTFTILAGSVGGRVTEAQVTVNDQSGNRYADVNGQYIQNFNARLKQGYACPDSSGNAAPGSDPDTCAAASRVPITRQQTFPEANNNGTIQLVTPRIAEYAVQDCVDGACPANLSMNVTFSVTDDLNRAQTVSVSKAPIVVYRVSDTRREE